MVDDIEELSSGHLTAKELLRTRGIYSKVCEEYAEVSKVLPKTGEKLFEPNGSWLENKQIITNLETMKDLIKVQRVSRASQLASAEWIPEEKRAKVTKLSGIDWNNYGHQINANIYLVPEEALLLLEMNCLNLTYNGMSLSIQQAYDLLLHSPNSGCTLDEYKVFSHLTRLGYHLQRFYYVKTNAERLEASMQPKKKVLIDPHNGNWMSNLIDSSEQHSSSNETCSENGKDDMTGVREVMDDISSKVESKENFNQSNNENNDVNDSVGPAFFSNDNKNKMNDNNIVENTDGKKETKEKVRPRLEILSEETIFDPIKLIVPSGKMIEKDFDMKSSWSGARIQRNVKQLPKRTDIKIPNYSSQQLYDNSTTPEKRKTEGVDAITPKKSKHEVIELSDDEIEEIPRKLTRMEMLNFFPNVASKDSISQVIPRNYIPPNVKPQKHVYEYDREQLNRIRQPHKNAKSNSSADDCTDISDNENPTSSASTSNNNANYSPTSSNVFQRPKSNFSNPLLGDRPGMIWENDQRQSYYQNNQGNFIYSNRSYNSQFTRGGGQSSNFIQHNIMTNCSINTNFYRQNFITNRWSSFHVNVFRNIATFAMRTSIIQNSVNIFPQLVVNNSFNNMMFGRSNMRFPNFPRMPGPQSHYFNQYQNQSNRQQSRQNSYSNNNNNSQLKAIMPSGTNGNEIYQPSFAKLPADSWTDLKKKWKDAKTITIEDEDNKMDCREVTVVDQTVQPLVGAKNSKNLADVYERLRIIKPAQVKTVRKKKGDYKISYKVYSNTQHYKKAVPGPPMFHLVITSNRKNFLQPVELNRLNQDGDGIAVVFAYVSGSAISFIQAGIVSLPNLTDSK